MGFLLHKYKFLLIAFVLLAVAVIAFFVFSNQNTVDIPPKGVFI